MGEEIPARMTIYIPQGGIIDPDTEFDEALGVESKYQDFLDALEMENWLKRCEKVLRSGGRIEIQDGSASYGQILEYNGSSAVPSWMEHLDVDYASDARYEFEAQVIFVRAGKEFQHNGTQDGEATITLTELEHHLKNGLTLADVVKHLQAPPIRYEVPDLSVDLDTN